MFFRYNFLQVLHNHHRYIPRHSRIVAYYHIDYLGDNYEDFLMNKCTAVRQVVSGLVLQHTSVR